MQVSDHSDFGHLPAEPKLSEILRSDIDEFLAVTWGTNSLLQRTNAGRLSPEVLGRYLRSLHYLIQNTMTHLALAEQRARAMGQLELAQHFALKRKEEAGHDLWAEADMRRLADRFGISVPEHPTQAMRTIVDANTKIVSEDPRNYLVYMLFAEYVTVVVGPAWMQALAEKCGIPSHLISVIEKHVELDKEHATEGCLAIDEFIDIAQADPVRQALRRMMQRLSDFSDGLFELQPS